MIQEFKKIFTRDQSLLIAESWYYAHDQGINAWHSGKRPHRPPIIFYVNQGVDETWHNTGAYQWIHTLVQEKVNEHGGFVHEHIIQYQQKMRLVEEYYRQKKLENRETLEKFIHHAYAAVVHFPVWYYAASNDRVPVDVRKEASVVRENDVFYDVCDRLVRNTLRDLYPHVRGYENFILRSEIKNPPALSVLKQRFKHFVFIPGITAEATDIDFYLHNHPEYVFQSEYSKGDLLADFVKGSSAFSGKVIGKVKIIRRLAEMDKVKQGDILVSPMTTPNYLSAMKRAAAFVTDEGSITCHAAIVARELKKPCIIGTKIAARVFKDGDRVEVDATRGIVRKIK